MEQTLAERIRASRQAYGMTQGTLAKRIGISKTAMNQMESGETIDPGVSRIREIARVLRVSADYLLGLSDEGGPESELVPTERVA